MQVLEPLIIERGIPIPPARGSRIGKRDGWTMNPLTLVLRKLAVGESVFIPRPGGLAVPRFHCNVSARARNVGRTYQPQRQYATRRLAGGARVWRLT